MRIGVWLAGLALLVAGTLAASADEAVLFAHGDLSIETAAGPIHRFDVELALTPRQRARGLMYRETMAADAGMLFMYPKETNIRMWMRDTLIPLDMIFVADDGRIVGIARDTTPLSERTIASPEPARAVIELNAGTAERLNIAPGDRVRHPFFQG